MLLQKLKCLAGVIEEVGTEKVQNHKLAGPEINFFVQETTGD